MSCSLCCCWCFALYHLSGCAEKAARRCFFYCYYSSIVHHWLGMRFVCLLVQSAAQRNLAPNHCPLVTLVLCWSCSTTRKPLATWDDDDGESSSLPIIIIIVSWSRVHKTVSISWIVMVRWSHTIHSVRLLVVTDSLLFHCWLEIFIVDQIAAVHIVVQTRWRLWWRTFNSWRWWTIMLTIWTLTRCGWWTTVTWQRRCKVLWFAPGIFLFLINFKLCNLWLGKKKVSFTHRFNVDRSCSL